MSKIRFSKEERESKLKLIEKTRNKITSMTCEFKTYLFDREKIINKLNLALEELELKTDKIILPIYNFSSLAFQFIEDYNNNISKQLNQTLLEKFRNCKNQCKKETKILLGKFSKIKNILPKQIKEFINEKITSVTDFIISNSRVLIV